ncbi:hypothetical protein [Sagittula sp. S175]|uniref:hypothetical protein n=1 Tax=Sagittula sp. S175 TaxID=3415129 RepID=UPI003C7EB4DC
MRTRKPRLIQGKPGPGVTEDTLHTIRDLIAQDPIYADPPPARPTVNHSPNVPQRPRRRFEPDATAPPPRYIYSRDELVPPAPPPARGPAPVKQRSGLSGLLSGLFRRAQKLHVKPS